MSWDAYFDCGGWNYTHNTNRMIAAALKDHAGKDTPPCGGSLGDIIGPAWWDELDGKSGAEGAAYLGQIITALEADPDKYRAMNPANGWGDYDSLVKVLQEMKRAGELECCDKRRWAVSG